MVFELTPQDISNLNDADLRELIGRLSEAELAQRGLSAHFAAWGGAQEATDGGVDVKIQVKNGSLEEEGGWIPKNFTIFQVKKNSMSAAACKAEMQKNGTVRLIIADLAKQHGAYIIVSGADNCSDKMLQERLRGMREAVAGPADNENLELDFYGADKISAWLRQYPGVALWARSKLGKPLSGWKSFERRAAAPASSIEKDEFLTDDTPCIHLPNSREKPLNLLQGIDYVRDILRKPGAVVRIVGLSGVGKTRFVQALFESDVGADSLAEGKAVYADLGDEPNPSAAQMAEYLIANRHDDYLILDNCLPDIHSKLQKKITDFHSKLRLLTVEYDISDDWHQETETIRIVPSGREVVCKLISNRFPRIDRLNAEKIAEFSGGNARLAIALAHCVKLNETLSNFSDNELFNKLFYQRKEQDKEPLRSAEILSLVYSFNVSDHELVALATISCISRSDLYAAHSELLRRQLIQRRGEWRAVLPQALANRLARRACENIQISVINRELFKAENKRLFQSCAHRLGYLHDCEAAVKLAESWVADGGLLHDPLRWNEERLQCIYFIAPLIPGLVLSILEKAAQNPAFVKQHCVPSRGWGSFSAVLRQLLCHLAYEDKYFDDAVNLLVLFYENEPESGKTKTVLDDIASLFSLYLSGTEATPQRRLAFVQRLMESSNIKHKRLAEELMKAALNTGSWTSGRNFSFGSKTIKMGWQPQNGEEVRDWYLGFIHLLEYFLENGRECDKAMAKKIIVSNFYNLCCSAYCFDALEKIVQKYAKGGAWPEIWIAVKDVISFSDLTHDDNIFLRLKKIQAIAAPTDLLSEIKAYAFVDIDKNVEHRSVIDVQYAEKEIAEKIIGLGEQTAARPELLQQLNDKIWGSFVNAVCYLGEGIARGSKNPMHMFQMLISMLREYQHEYFDAGILTGFLTEIYRHKPDLFRPMIEFALKEPKLKLSSVRLLCIEPITAWQIEKLTELAESGSVDARAFEPLESAHLRDKIDDADYVNILESVISLENGTYTVLDMLKRWSFRPESKRISDAVLLQVARKAIKKLLLSEREQDHLRLEKYRKLFELCLAETCPENEILEIIKLLFDGVENGYYTCFYVEIIIVTLLKNFPELTLDEIFFRENKKKRLIANLYHFVSLNSVPPGRLMAWCGNDQKKIQYIAGGINSFYPSGTPIMLGEKPRPAVLSDHIKVILDIATDKTRIVEKIFADIYPRRWSGSLADCLEERSHALKELLEYPSKEVKEAAKLKLKALSERIEAERAAEAKRNSEREQRFE